MPDSIFYTGQHLLSLIKKRPEYSNKGTFGTLVSLCGTRNMTGAAYLSSMAALRSGVGLLKLAADEYTQMILKNNLFEAIFIKPEEISEQPATAYLIGCGLGREQDAFLGDLLPTLSQKTVIDADGINYLAANINVLKDMRCEKILTPHPGEMGRLIGRDISYVQYDRVGIASSFAVEHNCILVLKGKDTVVAFPDRSVVINNTGNSGLAKGGSGDVLAGFIASLCAQGYSCNDAAVLGVYLHGIAADMLVARYGEHGLLPRDLPEQLGILLG